MEGLYEEYLTDGWNCFSGLAEQLSNSDPCFGSASCLPGAMGEPSDGNASRLRYPLGMEAWMIHGTEKAKGVLGGLLSGDTHYAGLAYPLVIRDTPFVCLAIMQLQYKPSQLHVICRFPDTSEFGRMLGEP